MLRLRESHVAKLRHVDVPAVIERSLLRDFAQVEEHAASQNAGHARREVEADAIQRGGVRVRPDEQVHRSGRQRPFVIFPRS